MIALQEFIGMNVNLFDGDHEQLWGGRLLEAADGWLLMSDYDSDEPIVAFNADDVRAIYIAIEPHLKAVDEGAEGAGEKQ